MYLYKQRLLNNMIIENEKQFRRMAASFFMMFPNVKSITYSRCNDGNCSIDIWKDENCFCATNGIWLHRNSFRFSRNAQFTTNNRPKYKMLTTISCNNFVDYPLRVKRSELKFLTQKPSFCTSSTQLKTFFKPLKEIINFNSLIFAEQNILYVNKESIVDKINLRGSGFRTNYRGKLMFN